MIVFESPPETFDVPTLSKRTPVLLTSRRGACTHCASTGGGPKRWQRGLDTALLDVDASLDDRLAGLRDALESPGEIAGALNEAVTALVDKGFAGGYASALDSLWPQGTLARADLDGLKALSQQAPEALSELRERGVPARPARATPTKLPTFGEALEGVTRLLSADTIAEVAEEAKNIFRKTPSGLEAPAYEVVRKGAGVELRRYAPFTVAKRKMAVETGETFSSAEGFSSLAGYLFGDNTEGRKMKMTVPVEISYDREDSDSGPTMAFVLPSEDATAAGGPPMPRDASVELAQVPTQLVAVAEFTGLATAREVERQQERLLKALDADGFLVPKVEGQYSVLQYNPPYTLPWRRRNEIAIVVIDKSEQPLESIEDDITEAGEQEEDGDVQLTTVDGTAEELAANEARRQWR